MGFNTVLMVLNDHMHTIEESPHALTYAICHPPQFGEKSMKMWQDHMRATAEKHGERIPMISPFCGINILPTFHADDVHFLYAGRNSLERLEFLRYGKARFSLKEGGHKEIATVTLALPDWADPKRH